MKSYVKPDLYYEDFELSSHIATCAIQMPNASNKNSCYTTIVGFDETIFAVEGICEYTDNYDAYCYTNSEEGYNLFNS